MKIKTEIASVAKLHEFKRAGYNPSEELNPQQNCPTESSCDQKSVCNLT